MSSPLRVIPLPLFSAPSFTSLPTGVTKPQGFSLSPFTLLSYTLNICNPASTIFAKTDFSELSPERSTALFSVGISPVEPWPAGQSCAAGMLINTGFQASSDTFLSL